MTMTQPGPLTDDLPPSGKRFVAAFTERFGKEPSRFAVAAAQAIDVLLDAIARSDGSRASVTRNLYGTRASNRIFRNFWITPTGDSTLNAVAVHRISRGKVTPFETVLDRATCRCARWSEQATRGWGHTGATRPTETGRDRRAARPAPPRNSARCVSLRLGRSGC
jgi:hypothetical protein